MHMHACLHRFRSLPCRRCLEAFNQLEHLFLSYLILEGP